MLGNVEDRLWGWEICSGCQLSILSYQSEAHDIPEKLTLGSHEPGTADSITLWVDSLGSESRVTQVT